MVALPCGPSYLGGWGKRIAWALEVEALQWAEIVPLLSSLGDKNKTSSQKKDWDRLGCVISSIQGPDAFPHLYI